MWSLASTKNPAAVLKELQGVHDLLYPGGDAPFISQAFFWARECFTGQHPGYQAVDAGYHDFEHTLQGAQCLLQLLRGRQLAGALPVLPERCFQLGLMAILFHDTGYLKRSGDLSGTGAKYTITHVARSAAFAADFLLTRGFSPAEIQSVQNMILSTGAVPALGEIPFQSESERVLGHALSTADLLGQMAAEDYVDKLPVLYAEFSEAVRFTGDTSHFISGYASAEQLIHATPLFWKTHVLPRLDRDFGGLYRFLNHPFPDGPNPYLDRIEANLTRLRAAGAAL